MPHLLVLIAVAALGAHAPAHKRKFMLLPDILHRMEKSPITYRLESTDKLTDLDVADFGEKLYPQRVRLIDTPQVVVRNGRRTVAPAPCEAANPIIHTAENLFQSANYAAAGALYQTAMDKAPRCYLGFAYYGDSLFFAKKPAEALPFYDKAIKLDPDEGALYTFRSNAYVRLNRIPEAVDDLRWSLTLRPHHRVIAQILTKSAGKLGVRYEDPVFKPRAFARKEGDGYTVYSDPQKTYWIGYGMCKALWLSDPAHRKEYSGTAALGFSQQEELECIAALMTAYEGERATKHIAVDPELEFLDAVARSGDIQAWIVYELGSRISPQVVLTLDAEGRKHVFDFVKRHVIVDAP